MPRAKAEKVFSNFSKGLITEASALAFPENAYVSGDNVEIDIKGKISRRLGMDIEPGVVQEEVDEGDPCHIAGLTLHNYLYSQATSEGLELEINDADFLVMFGWNALLGPSNDSLPIGVSSVGNDFKNGYAQVSGSITLGEDGFSPGSQSAILPSGTNVLIPRASIPGNIFSPTFLIKILELPGSGQDPIWIGGFSEGNGVSASNEVDQVIALTDEGRIQVSFVTTAGVVDQYLSSSAYSVGDILFITSSFWNAGSGQYVLVVNESIEIDLDSPVGDYWQNSGLRAFNTTTYLQIGGQGNAGSNNLGVSGSFQIEFFLHEVQKNVFGYRVPGVFNAHERMYEGINLIDPSGPSEAGYIDYISRVLAIGSPASHYRFISDLVPEGTGGTFLSNGSITFTSPITSAASYGAVAITPSSNIYRTTGVLSGQFNYNVWLDVGIPSSGHTFLLGEFRDTTPTIGSFAAGQIMHMITVSSDGRIHFTHNEWANPPAWDVIANTFTYSSTRQINGGLNLISVQLYDNNTEVQLILAVNGKHFIDATFSRDAFGTLAANTMIGGMSGPVGITGEDCSAASMIIGNILSMFSVIRSPGENSVFASTIPFKAPANFSEYMDDESGLPWISNHQNDATMHNAPHLDYYCNGVASSGKYDAFPLTPSNLFGSEKYTFLKWTSVNGVSGDDVLVIAGGNRVVFYDLRAQLLTFEVIGGFDLQGVSGSTSNNRIALAAGSGRLYVSGDNINPQVVELDIVNKTVSIDLIEIQIRDLEGIDEGIPVDFNPLTLNDDHRYNLQNQGWPLGENVRYYRDRKKTKIRGATPEGAYYAARRNYPSNAESYAFYVDGVGVFDAQTANTTIGTSPAPKGRLFLDAFNQRRGANVGLNTTASSKITSRRPTAIAFYAGRVWYSGVSDKDFVGKVYFSQVIKTNVEAGKCHQQNDPTSPELSDLLATDGGVLDVPEAGNIQSMNTLGNGLLLFGDNGIWVIKGGDGVFSADNFSVDKIHDASILAPDTLVQAENAIYFLGKNSIYAVQEDSTGLRFVAQSISETTIQSFYNGISENSKKESTGAYIQSQQRVVWLYSGDEQYEVRSKYTNGLVFDIKLGAFTTFTLGDQVLSPKIFGVIEKTTQNTESTLEIVTVGGANVTVGGEDVTISSSIPISTSTDIKFIAAAESKGIDYLVFTSFSNRNFVDWESVDNVGIDYTSFFETGFDNLGDLIRNKKAPYLWSFMTRTEDGFSLLDDLGGGAKTVILDNPSGCLLQYKWDWSDSEASKRWSSKRQIYRLKQFIPADENDPFDYGYEVVETRNKVRGSGKSLKLRFESETGKDMQIEGWAIEYSAGGRRSKT
jgi:hypothetical protein